jgi:hypothetical protein
VSLLLYAVIVRSPATPRLFQFGKGLGVVRGATGNDQDFESQTASPWGSGSLSPRQQSWDSRAKDGLSLAHPLKIFGKISASALLFPANAIRVKFRLVIAQPRNPSCQHDL